MVSTARSSVPIALTSRFPLMQHPLHSRDRCVNTDMLVRTRKGGRKRMTEKMTRLTRRDLMRTAGASVLFAPAIIRAANAQSKFDWKRFAGQKIDVLYVKNTRADMLVAKTKEFEALTGIQVSAEAIPEQQQRQKVTIEFTSGKPTFDVVALSLHVQKRIAAKGKWLTDLKPFIADGSLTSPDLDFADIGQAGLNFSTQNDGSLDTMPKFVDYWILYYNKELFEQKGAAYPKTMDEIVTAA